MKLLILLLFALFCVFTLFALDDSFDAFFTEGAVRYDFELSGNSDTAKVIHKQSKFLGKWGGNPSLLIDGLDYGTYRYRMFDAQNGSLLFKKGFSPLFNEWQLTEEALKRERSFYQSVFFPRPKSNVVIEIEQRCEMNIWHQLYSDTLFIDDYFIIDENPFAYQVDTLQYNGCSSEKIDLVILAEGYREQEMEKFVTDAQGLIDYLFSAEPFSTYRSRFNVLAVKVPSQQSGTDIPGEGIYVNTAFNSHFYTFDSPRYLTVSDMKSVYDALDAVAWDQFYVLVNTDRYGGGGCYNFFNVCSSDNVQSGFVFCHEFAHGFAGLADEYYTSSTAYDEYYRLDVEPVEPNITTLVDFETKWKSMVDAEIPIPSPRDEIYSNVVGVFEGGGYMEKGIYSPVMSCWMKEKSAGGFCPVCQKAIEKVILMNTE